MTNRQDCTGSEEGRRADRVRERFADCEITRSHGRTGQCWDNAPTESFFASIKGELLDLQPWPTRTAARRAVVEYIAWYNGLASGEVTDSYEPTPQTTGWDIYFTVTLPPITISCNATQATVGQPYVGTLTATGGNGLAFTWNVSGFPSPLTGTASGATFTISGTPTGPGTFQIFAVVFDGQTFSKTCELLVMPRS